MTRRLVLPLLLVALTGCAAPSAIEDADQLPAPAPKTFDSHGISFSYPGDWIPFEAETPDPSQGNLPTSRDLLGLDDLNVVSITAQPAPSFHEGASLWSRKIQSLLSQAFEENGIDVTNGPEKVLLAGERGLRWVISQPSGVGYVLTSTVVMMIRGGTEYDVKCQHTAARAPEIARGCEQLLGTFALSPAKP